MASNPFRSAHRDVLDATPTDEAGKLKLVEELRERSKGAIKAGQHPAADLLYSKAIELMPDATLYGNRSMVRVSTGKFAEALEDAEMAIELDATYAKAFYRKGMACMKLNKHDEAKKAFDQGAVLEPTNKTFKSLADKARASALAAAEAAAKAAAEPPKPKPVIKMPVVVPRGMENVNTKMPSASGSSDMKGYKVTADGRKTTFFNNELDDEAKKLIGDITPQKIDSAGDDAAAAAAAAAGKSAWNTAGTWEERTMTPWGKEKLEELLVGAEFAFPNDMGTVRTTKLRDVVGDCSITMMRNKKKWLFDWAFTLDWEVELKGIGMCKGFLKYPDVTPDAEGDYEATMEVDSSTPPPSRALLESYIRPSGAGLQPAVAARVGEFIAAFNAIE